MVIVNTRDIAVESMDIYDLTGRLLKRVDIDSMQSEIITDVSSLSNGNYMAILKSAQGAICLRWVKM